MRGATWLSLGAVVMGLGAAFACSSSPPGPPYPDVSSFCTALASAECQVIPNACGNNPTRTQCETTETTFCQNAATAASATGRKYDTDNAKACVDLATKTYSGTSNNPRVSGGDLDSLATTCDAVFSGTAADNSGTCTTDADCANSSSVCTFIPVTATTGYCGQPQSVSKGAPCNNPGDQCSTSFCGGAAPPYTCQTLLANGSACTVNAQCQGHCVSGICASLGAIGAACTTTQDCDSAQAAAGAFCDPSRGNTCQNGETFDNGEPECSDFGFGATVGVAVAQDAGGNPPVDSGEDTGTDSGNDSGSTDGATE